MEKAIKGEFGLDKRTRRELILGAVIFCMLSVTIYIHLFGDVRQIVRVQAINSITNISELNVETVSRSIKNRRTLLELISNKLSKEEMNDTEEILKEIEGYVKPYEFYNMGIMREDFKLYSTKGSVMDASGYPSFHEAWDLDFHLSRSFMPVDGGSYAVNLFSYPVCFDGKLQYVVVATYISKNLTERMNISFMGKKGYNFILNPQGEVMIYPRHVDDETYRGLMKYVNDTPKIIPDEKGDTYFSYNDEQYYSHFEPLGVDDWYLMTCAKERDVFSEAKSITYRVFIGMGVLWLMIILALMGIAYSVYKSKHNIRQAVFYDKLLGIGNGKFLAVFFKKIPDEEFKKLALVYLDVDRFKEFNYIYGEECGDRLLKYIVKVFQEELPEDYFFRYYSDNFVALVHCDDKEEFQEKIDRVLRRFSDDIDHDRIQPFDVSAGVRRMHVGDSYRRIMSDALIAKGTIKGIQVQQYAFYDEDIRYRRTVYMSMESDFSRALREQEFHVYYQPKYDMRTGRIVGAEALARWVKDNGTIISPGEFIPCFEASRQIILLDEAMLESVCRQMKEMEDDGLEVQKVSVNLSRVHLRRHGILEKIEHIVKDSGVDPSKISFEITESALYEDSIPLKNIVESLHRLGCKVDMDDYGIGVSGPNALAANKFDMVKLDKSFIDGIGDERMESVIRSTIYLSRELGMEILAEGVEEKYQADCLVEWGCDLAQGFYYSKPVPEAEYRRLLRENQRG